MLLKVKLGFTMSLSCITPSGILFSFSLIMLPRTSPSIQQAMHWVTVSQGHDAVHITPLFMETFWCFLLADGVVFVPLAVPLLDLLLGADHMLGSQCCTDSTW